MESKIPGLLLLIHASVSLVPAISAHGRGDIESTGGALALLLVVTVATTASASNVRGLLALAHAWSALAHIITSASRRPTRSISGLPHALRAVIFSHPVLLTRRHRLNPSLIVGRECVLDR